jgi:glycosyltransferase involved in cell wall biosynthesis
MFQKLSIIIPAYDEEDAIASIIERSLDAKSSICENTSVDDVEIIVVSDGSTDQTVPIAQEYEPDITLINYVPNKGYGAAIKTGFHAASGDLVSFLDADGTCDPLFFIDMINTMEKESADIVIGSRMGKQSKMPGIRRFGNQLFVNLIKILSKQKLTDSASGMRVIRKDRLPEIYPLPDGLHFTPAMSVKAIFDSNLKIAEIDMTYEERVGDSKLHVLKDGIRFLRVIIEAALGYNAFRFLGLIALLLFIFSSVYLAEPVIFYIKHQSLQEWMIYRLIAVSVTTTSGILLLVIGKVTQSLTDMANLQYQKKQSFFRRLSDAIFLRYGLLLSLFFLVIATIIMWNPINQYLSSGKVYTHWSVILFGGQCLLLSVISFASGSLQIGLQYIRDKIIFKP